jgi:hypothetical protein
MNNVKKVNHCIVIIIITKFRSYFIDLPDFCLPDGKIKEFISEVGAD